MREPALGLKTSLLNGGSFLKRIHENLQSVWRLPWAPLPAAQWYWQHAGKFNGAQRIRWRR